MHADSQARPRAAMKRILVVDDNLDQVRSLAMMFNTMGYPCDYAINGTVASEMAAKYRPDIVFLDLLLPDGHGAAICREIRAIPGLKETRIFAISASSRMLDYQRAIDAGCDDVLRKPVSPATFERLISGGMNRRKLREMFARQGDKNS
jgi:two-component system, OmpR family, alkaline phosphatase synthesis response regulator PhoP